MANWVENTIICKSNLVSSIVNGDDVADFSILIPEPQTKEECIREYGMDYIDEGNKPLQHEEGREWFDWFRWHCDFWGCKWNACDTTVEKSEYVYVTFSTPWSAPMPWIEKLSKLGQPFIHYWIEEQGFGMVQGYNGDLNATKKINTEWGIPEEDDDEGWYDNFPSTKAIKAFFNDK